MSKGIDYGRGLTNIDHATGIRYGVIPIHAVLQAWCDESEAEYGEATCPKCGNPAREIKTRTESSDPPGQWISIVHDEEIPDDWETDGCGDYLCDDCKYAFDAENEFVEPLGHFYNAGGYECTGDETDIFILKSPYYTRAAYCSPCAPGACYLLNADDSGDRAYCFGHDWFDDNKAPYPVYRASDDSLVEPEPS